MAQLNGQNTDMIKHIQKVQTQTVLMNGQLQECHTHWQEAMADNHKLQQHLGVLTQELQVWQVTQLACGEVPAGTVLQLELCMLLNDAPAG